MVCRDECNAVHFYNGIYYLSYTVINGFHSLYRCIKYACMSYHVTVGKIQYNHIILTAFDSLDSILCHFICTHFGL